LTGSDSQEQRPRKTINPAEAHVLVVEDNVPNFVLIARLLAFMGIQKCEWKTTGWGVVEFAKTMPKVDLILMDLRLPHEDGYEALEQLRGDEDLCDTLVVVVTAQASPVEMQKARQAGFDGFLSKPLDADVFPGQIRRILEGESVWEMGN
jgi:two-component system, cell cycle response regulator DivK